MLINFACLFISGTIDLTFVLKVFTLNNSRGHYSWTHLRFAVLDLNKSESYPSNFVSILPMRIDSDGKIPSAFTKLFGNKSLKTARGLLTVSLKKEHSSEIKAEIERRLNLLESNPIIHIKCRVCKRYFQIRKEEARNQSTCLDCTKRFDRKK